MSVELVYAETVTITEVLPDNPDSAAAANRTVTHSLFNVAGSLGAATTPVADDQGSFVKTLSAGAGTVDLRALPGTNNSVRDGNGKKVQIVRVKNLGANPLTISAGASNGHTGIFGATGLTIPAGGSAMIVTNDGGVDIDATHKTWDLVGTAAQQSQWTVVLG